MVRFPSIVTTLAFSICIPQYNRTSFLLRALDSLREQTFREFEVCISDDCSNDGRTGELLQYLQQSGLRFRFEQTKENSRYDKNLRNAIRLAQGRYCFLLGNDDRVAEPTTLEELYGRVMKYECPEVVITNYREISTGRTFRRVPRSGVLGAGPKVAAANFRNLSFVSGLLLDRKLAHKHSTEKWDGAAMYQMYLCTRMVAAGGHLLAVSDVAILKDIQIPGEGVDSYQKWPVLKHCPIQERPLNLAPLGRIVFDAIAPYVRNGERDRFARRIFSQLLFFTYPPWIIEYRRVQSWRYAVGVFLGMRPRNLLRDLSFKRVTVAFLRLLYIVVGTAALCIPIALFEKAKPWLHQLAKRGPAQ